MKKKLIIFTHGGGRFANQMTNQAHLIAFQQEYGGEFDIINIAMGPYSRLFDSMSDSKIQYIPSGHGRLKAFVSVFALFVVSREYKKISSLLFNQLLRSIHFLFAILPFSQSIKYGKAPGFLPFLPGVVVDDFDLNCSATLSILQRKRITALAGWPIRSWNLFQKYQDVIRKSFEVRHDYLQNAKKFIGELRMEHNLLIGILIRQTDYRRWLDGKYFFETEQYITWMKQAEKMFPQKKIGFVIASDEPQELERFRPLSTFFSTGIIMGNAHFIESFAELSMCDYVMTPPSTFGIWTAFLGNIPVIPLCEKNQSVNGDDIMQNHMFDCFQHPHFSILTATGGPK